MKRQIALGLMIAPIAWLWWTLGPRPSRDERDMVDF